MRGRPNNENIDIGTDYGQQLAYMWPRALATTTNSTLCLRKPDRYD